MKVQRTMGLRKPFIFDSLFWPWYFFIGCGSNSRSNEPTAICASSAPSHAGASSASIVGMHKAYWICTVRLVEKVCLYFWQLQFLWCCVGLGPTVDADGVALGSCLCIDSWVGALGRYHPDKLAHLDETTKRESGRHGSLIPSWSTCGSCGWWCSPQVSGLPYDNAWANPSQMHRWSCKISEHELLNSFLKSEKTYSWERDIRTIQQHWVLPATQLHHILPCSISGEKPRWWSSMLRIRWMVDLSWPVDLKEVQILHWWRKDRMTKVLRSSAATCGRHFLNHWVLLSPFAQLYAIVITCIVNYELICFQTCLYISGFAFPRSIERCWIRPSSGLSMTWPSWQLGGLVRLKAPSMHSRLCWLHAYLWSHFLITVVG